MSIEHKENTCRSQPRRRRDGRGRGKVEGKAGGRVGHDQRASAPRSAGLRSSVAGFNRRASGASANGWRRSGGPRAKGLAPGGQPGDAKIPRNVRGLVGWRYVECRVAGFNLPSEGSLGEQVGAVRRRAVERWRASIFRAKRALVGGGRGPAARLQRPRGARLRWAGQERSRRTCCWTGQAATNSLADGSGGDESPWMGSGGDELAGGWVRRR